MKKSTHIRLSDLTVRQLAELVAATGNTQTEVIERAVDRMHREETQTMNSQTSTLTTSQLNDIIYGPGLYATFAQTYTAYVDSDHDDNGKRIYTIHYCHEAMPPHKTDDFATVEELAIVMQETAPLNRWKTIELDDEVDDEVDDDDE